MNEDRRQRGVLGILVEGKHRGLIPAVAPLVGRLRDEVEFRMSAELIHDMLQVAGEEPPAEHGRTQR